MVKKGKKNILLTCAGGSGMLYLAQNLKKRHNIFLIDANKYSAASHFNFPFKTVPFGNNQSYVPAIDSLVRRWKIDYIVPASDEEVVPIKIYCEKNPFVVAIAPSLPFIKQMLSKKETIRAISALNISHLKPFCKKAEIKYPAIVKPDFGRGAQYVHVINRKRGLEGYLKLYGKRFHDIQVEPYIDGDEYTISVIVNNLNKIIGIVPKKVVVRQKGLTKLGISQKNTLMETACKKIVEKLKPHGPCNVQIILRRNKLYIFEINPRISNTTSLTEKAFGNEIELYLRYYNKTTITNTPTLKENISVYRYDKNLFIKN